MAVVQPVKVSALQFVLRRDVGSALRYAADETSLGDPPLRGGKRERLLMFVVPTPNAVAETDGVDPIAVVVEFAAHGFEELLLEWCRCGGSVSASAADVDDDCFAFPPPNNVALVELREAVREFGDDAARRQVWSVGVDLLDPRTEIDLRWSVALATTAKAVGRKWWPYEKSYP